MPLIEFVAAGVVFLVGVATGYTARMLQELDEFKELEPDPDDHINGRE